MFGNPGTPGKPDERRQPSGPDSSKLCIPHQRARRCRLDDAKQQARRARDMGEGHADVAAPRRLAAMVQPSPRLTVGAMRQAACSRVVTDL
jgi:hypothetical protein